MHYYYIVYKFTLNPKKFGQQNTAQDFINFIFDVIKKLDIIYLNNKKINDSKTREVLFYDTPNKELYHHHFILRKRLLDNATHAELTLKFRHTHKMTASIVDLQPHVSLTKDATIKFKDQLLVNKNILNSQASHLYSHSCTIDVPTLFFQHGIENIHEVFPELKQIGINPNTQLQIVNNIDIEETLINIGKFDFGKNTIGKATLFIWRDNNTKKALASDFEMQFRFENIDKLSDKTAKLVDLFCQALFEAAPDWFQSSATKTSFIYGD